MASSAPSFPCIENQAALRKYLKMLKMSSTRDCIWCPQRKFNSLNHLHLSQQSSPTMFSFQQPEFKQPIEVTRRGRATER
ncbi:hypothetical protein BHM03_00024250 [Ensete ventricosum]|uniref:Uncharacterized protein n=1 Tax=Ensete ventricosum TaxID=4639 RepID=A0A426ZDL2_ENSVE|nr:hypothetical protein B296_00015331 [Ensete ventricosum]RZR95397.1 hypothetical protein BHM03_00024250 [Ensete ventricosum]